LRSAGAAGGERRTERERGETRRRAPHATLSCSISKRFIREAEDGNKAGRILRRAGADQRRRGAHHRGGRPRG
ncbi:MAG: hypothetical protein K8H90_06025, partial [Thermoanaerobaculia bacterium]|nr:hypothetical protein [Thermoanaerobaculia bacterium]